MRTGSGKESGRHSLSRSVVSLRRRVAVGHEEAELVI